MLEGTGAFQQLVGSAQQQEQQQQQQRKQAGRWSEMGKTRGCWN
jgi:hypothetical protein